MSDKRNKIRIIVVEDSITAREIIIGILESDPDISVIGEARNGKEAIELTRRLKPDLITMDIKMPVMNGLEAIKHIMAYYPTPIVVLCSSAFRQGESYVFKALDHGALDIMEKPDPQAWREFPEMGKKLISDIKSLAKVPVITHLKGKKRANVNGRISAEKEQSLAADKLVVIAASTGGPTALLEVIKRLPKDLPASVMIVQHIAEGFIEGLVEWLDAKSKIKVRLAINGEQIRNGIAYVAPSDVHMIVGSDKSIRLSGEPPVSGLRPAANHLFFSAIEFFNNRIIGIILTGMGKDGVDGLKAIRDAGGVTIAQDKKSSLVYGMPRVASESGAAEHIVDLEKIAAMIIKTLE